MAHDHRMNPVGEPHLNKRSRRIARRKANEANQGYPTGDENRGESNDDMGSYDGHSYTDGDY